MDRKKRILTVLEQLISIDSQTDTEKEQAVETYLLHWLHSCEHTEAGLIPAGDAWGRSTVYGLVRSADKKADTIIFMNHHDVVDTSAYGLLSGDAFSPELLKQQLLQTETDEEVLADLRSGEWLFGRGSCDMKGGMAAQLAVFEAYANKPGMVNLLFLSVPDEESFSVGMRTVLPFLQDLQDKMGLTYRLLVDCEPNQREQGRLTAFSGSVGKLLPVVLVQGKAVHIGNYHAGLNPLGLLADIVVATEGRQEWADTCDGEMSPPPVWMYMRDRKGQYDFSVPHRAAAYASFLAYDKTPADVIAILKKVAQSAVTKNAARTHTASLVPVMTVSEWLQRVASIPGFDEFYTKLRYQSEEAIRAGHSTYPEETITILEKILDFCGETEPLILVAFAPPYYPAADSLKMGDAAFPRLLADLEERFPICFQRYFNGVSDCSYCGIDPTLDTAAVEQNTPLWGRTYSFDLSLLQQLQIPFMLLGPWGKELHGRCERIQIESVTSVLPTELQYIVEWLEKNV